MSEEDYRKEILSTVNSQCRLAFYPMNDTFTELSGPEADKAERRVKLMDVWCAVVNRRDVRPTPLQSIQSSPYYRDETKFWQDLGLGVRTLSGDY